MKKYKIAVAGTGYVGLSIATLLSQHHHVTAVDIVPEKVEMINNRKPPIQDDYMQNHPRRSHRPPLVREELHTFSKAVL